MCVCVCVRGEPGAPRHLHLARPCEETEQEKSEGKQSAWICLPATGAAHADRPRGAQPESPRLHLTAPGV